VHVAHTGEIRNAYNIVKVSTKNSKRKRVLGKPRRRWKNTVNIDLEERVQRRVLMNTVMNLRVPYKAGNFLTSCATISFSRKTTP
jgi:hypothetical protein